MNQEQRTQGVNLRLVYPRQKESFSSEHSRRDKLFTEVEVDVLASLPSLGDLVARNSALIDCCIFQMLQEPPFSELFRVPRFPKRILLTFYFVTLACGRSLSGSLTISQIRVEFSCALGLFPIPNVWSCISRG